MNHFKRTKSFLDNWTSDIFVNGINTDLSNKTQEEFMEENTPKVDKQEDREKTKINIHQEMTLKTFVDEYVLDSQDVIKVASECLRLQPNESLTLEEAKQFQEESKKVLKVISRYQDILNYLIEKVYDEDE